MVSIVWVQKYYKSFPASAMFIIQQINVFENGQPIARRFALISAADRTCGTMMYINIDEQLFIYLVGREVVELEKWSQVFYRSRELCPTWKLGENFQTKKKFYPVHKSVIIGLELRSEAHLRTSGVKHRTL